MFGWGVLKCGVLKSQCILVVNSFLSASDTPVWPALASS